MNCIEGMRLVPSNKIDLIVKDPPFAIDFKATKQNYNRTASRVMQGYNEIQQKDYYDFSVKWMNQAYRLLKESGSMYVFSGWNNLKDILNALDDIGFVTVNHIIWNDRMLGEISLSRYECTFFHHSPKFLNFFSVDGRLTDTYLEPVIFRGIVASGDHDAAADRQSEQ